METTIGAEIQGETIEIGRKAYIDCTFLDCRIVFDGTADKNRGCRYVNCAIKVEGAAVETLKFLRTLWDGGGFNIVQDISIQATGRALSFDR